MKAFWSGNEAAAFVVVVVAAGEGLPEDEPPVVEPVVFEPEEGLEPPALLICCRTKSTAEVPLSWT